MELMTREEVEAAYHLADAEGSEVIVERFVRGNEHPLLRDWRGTLDLGTLFAAGVLG